MGVCIYICIGHADIWGMYWWCTDVWWCTDIWELYRCIALTDILGDVLVVYRCMRVYRGQTNVWGICIYIGEVYRCIGHTDIWEDVLVAYRCMGDVQMYGECTDV